MRNYAYAGIGSRDTPLEILKLMSLMGKHLAQTGYTLRSGAAQGADAAFEAGCDYVSGPKEIYIPWPKFQESKSTLVLDSLDSEKATKIAEEFHPYWHNLSQGARKLQARNSHQVLGKDLESPSDFIVCYTKNGKGSGGTGQAIRIAAAHGIPVFDCGLYEDNIKTLKDEYRAFLRRMGV